MSAEGPGTEAADRREFRWNYVAHVLDGGLFMGALGFVSGTTVMPTIIKRLGGPDWLVSLMPVMLMMGFMVPPVFTAHRIERLGRYMPLLLVTGIFQRLPYLVAALALLVGAGTAPLWVLAAVAVAPLVSGMSGGVSMTAWQQLVLRTVRPNRLSSVFATRYVLSAALGLGAGWVVKAVLAAWPGEVGYGVLHLCAFGSVALSYAAFALIREGRAERLPEGEAVGLWENLRAIPGLLAGERRLALYLGSQAFANGIFILAPFLAMHAQRSLGRPESYLGDLLIAQMVGAIVGNLVSGYLGDRFGGKVVMMMSQGLFVWLSCWSAMAASDAAFRAIFFLFGFAFFSLQVGRHTLVLGLCPTTRRSTYLAMTSLVNLPSILAATGLSAAVWRDGVGFVHLAWSTAACVALSLVLVSRVRDPRGETAAPAPAGGAP